TARLALQGSRAREPFLAASLHAGGDRTAANTEPVGQGNEPVIPRHELHRSRCPTFLVPGTIQCWPFPCSVSGPRVDERAIQWPRQQTPLLRPVPPRQRR